MNYPCNCLFKFLFAIKHKRFKHYNNRKFFFNGINFPLFYVKSVEAL